MKYIEAEEASSDCKYALVVALEDLPQEKPDSNQEATILCNARYYRK